MFKYCVEVCNLCEEFVRGFILIFLEEGNGFYFYLVIIFDFWFIFFEIMEIKKIC